MVEQVDREAAAERRNVYLLQCDNARLVAALQTVKRTLEKGQDAIVCTVWADGEANETLLDHVNDALKNKDRQQAEQRLIDIAQACLDQGYPLAVALEMMKGQNDG